MLDTRRSRSSSNAALAGLLLLTSACSSPGTAPAPVPSPTPGAPQITCPADISQASPNDGAVVVTYALPIAVNGVAPVTVGCSPAPGSPFPLGATAVTCTASDAAGRLGSCGFIVRITLAPKLQRTRFMAFGDSMTVGVVALRGPRFQLAPSPTSYPGRLEVLLAQRYTSQTISMDDEGAQGEKAATAPSRLRSLLHSSSPEAVLLLEGANDVNDGESALDAAVASLEAMMAECEDAGAATFLANLPPQREGGLRASHPELVAPFNARLAAVAAARGAELVDLHAAFGGIAATDLIGPDGLHPTEAGYQRIAETFFAAIKARLEVTAGASRLRSR